MEECCSVKRSFAAYSQVGYSLLGVDTGYHPPREGGHRLSSSEGEGGDTGYPPPTGYRYVEMLLCESYDRLE